MASLLAKFNVGTTSVSSLVKSATSLQNELATYNDAEQAYDYEFSNKTDADFAAYQTYLQGRITTLQSTGTITDASKALTLQKTMMTAQNSNITSNIQRENIEIMSGTASDSDKLATIQAEFSKAVSIGDMSTAQTLESQAYSLSQTIQDKAQAAATASSTLASASASSGASEENNVATQLEDRFKQLNADTAAGGMAALNKNLKSWVTANKTSLLALADGTSVAPSTKSAIEKAVNTSQPNYFDIAQGVGQAMVAAHYQAYVAELPYDPETAQGYLDSATNIANGTTKLTTLAGDMSLTDIQKAQQNPAMFVPKENANTGQLEFSLGGGDSKPTGTSSISGYKFDGNGQVIANYTGQATGTQLTASQVKEVNTTLTKLGFSFKPVTTSDSNDNGVTVQAANSPKWLQPILAGQKNVELQAYDTKQGIVTASLDANGKANIYLIATDSKGLNAVYKATGQAPDGNPIFGKQTAVGDYGFNQQNNSLWKTNKAPISVPQSQLPGAKVNLDPTKMQGLTALKGSPFAQYGLGRTNTNELIMQSQAKISQIAQQKLAAQQQLQAQQAAASARNFASVKIPTSQPSPQPAAPAPVLQPTVSPQPQTVNPQGNNVNPQGNNVGAGLNQSGTGGVKLSASVPTQGIKL